MWINFTPLVSSLAFSQLFEPGSGDLVASSQN
jgi:hypothetical protein